MPVTTLRGRQVLDGDITRADINTSTSGSAVIAKVIAGTGISISSTGVDAGTGDVTISTVNNGTVTSVGLALPAIFTVSNSPVTSSGTLTAALASQTANTFLGAPNGSAGAPSFRAIVAADVPTLNQNTTGSAATLTTARTLTIGSTGKTFNGSANVAWTLAEIGAAAISHTQEITTITKPTSTQGIDTHIKPLFDITRADRTAFLPADQIIIEKSVDAGATWQDAAFTDNQKRDLFNGARPAISLPLINGVKDTNAMIRVTITGMKYNQTSATGETDRYNYWNSTYVQSTERYCTFDEGWAWVNSNSDRIWFRFERATGAAPNTWTIVREGWMSGWSGGNYFSLDGNVFGGGTTQTTNAWNWRITFRTGTPSLDFNNANLAGGIYASTAQNIHHLKITGANVYTWSNQLMYADHIYSWDRNQNAIFPAIVQGSQFTSTRANDVATGAAQIYLNGASGNRIDFNTNGTSAPTFTNRSTGTKIVLYPSITSTSVDTAIGYLSDAGGPAMWFSMVSNISGRFAFFGGQTEVFRVAATGQTQFLAGTVALPVISAGLANSGDSNTGIYFPAADTIGFVEGGVEAMRLDANARLNLTAGTAANPIINAGLNSSDTDTGIYFPGANSVSISTGGTERFNVNSAGVPTFTYADNTFQGINIRNTSNTSNALNGLSIYDSANTAVGQFNYVNSVFANGALQNTVLINSVGNIKLGFVASSNITASTNSDIYFQAGSTTAGRMIYIDGDAAMVGIGMGASNPSLARLQVRGAGATSATTALIVENSSSTAALSVMDDGQIRVGAGTVSLPAISAGLNSSDTNTGVYFPAADAIGFATNGTRRVRIDNTGVGLHTDPSAWIHLSSDPASNKWIRIDAARSALTPDERNNGAPDTGIGSLVLGGKYLAEPNYWMEIYLGTNKVLVPCYTEGCGNCQLPGE